MRRCVSSGEGVAYLVHCLQAQAEGSHTEAGNRVVTVVSRDQRSDLRSPDEVWIGQDQRNSVGSNSAQASAVGVQELCDDLRGKSPIQSGVVNDECGFEGRRGEIDIALV